MKTKYRVSSGLAMSPASDMAMLSKMSRRGWSVTSMSSLGYYRFKQSEPKEEIFDITMVQDPSDDYADFFLASGWTPVVVMKGFQIFRAAPGAPPLFSDESRVSLLRQQRRIFGLWALVALLLTAILALLAWKLEWGIVGPLLGWIPIMVLLVCTSLPYFGLIRLIRKETKRQQAAVGGE